jgi:hypothetical protein
MSVRYAFLGISALEGISIRVKMTFKPIIGRQLINRRRREYEIWEIREAVSNEGSVNFHFTESFPPLR